ncbi:hypothetical protein QBC40DRAFT_287553 [Triangularia verruculosa]|uniref:NmrA-like domain-containing protein n=1 Tax=Triangularia verruculosa TaxID=2587418 RepID=A0AAN6XEF1_9PEZI|nr:hypothetical protein QBC40DRAFT_287553 [Triangularia verruculosa]
MPTVFVTSATGSVGSALCQQLRALGWGVRATTQNPDSKSAQILKEIGVELVPGDWDDEEALRTGLAGCDKLFLCLLPDLGDFNKVPARAKNIAALAKAAGVKQAVGLTTLGAFAVEEGTKPPAEYAPSPFFTQHFHAKKRVEQALMDGGFDHWTILRPGFFMANFLEPKIHMGYTEIRDNGTWTNSMTETSPLGLVDHVDIAQFAVAAFQKPELLHGRLLAVVSEEPLVQEALDQLAAAIGDGRFIKAKFLSDEECAKVQAEGGWRFFSSETCVRYMSDYTDLGELNELIGGLTAFKEFLEREKEGVKQTYLGQQGG